MTCTSPVDAWMGPKGTGIVFSQNATYRGAKQFRIPCGKCIRCRLDWARDWGTRVGHELQMAGHNGCFVTLTYADEHLPPDGGLSVRDMQLFIKRLRFEFSDTRVRYFCGGEYGEKLWRPHYHMILIGISFDDERKPWRQTKGGISYRVPTLERLWSTDAGVPIGNVEVMDANERAAEYCARYTVKKVGGDPAIKHYSRHHPVTGEVFQVAREFMLSSRKPGLGHSFFAKYKDEIINSGCVRMSDGSRRRIPKYYLNQLPPLERLTFAARMQAEGEARERRQRQLDAQGRSESGDSRLLVKDQLAELSARRLVRGE